MWAVAVVVRCDIAMPRHVLPPGVLWPRPQRWAMSGLAGLLFARHG